MRVIVVDDTIITGRLIAEYLKQVDGLEPEVYSDPAEGLRACDQGEPDMILVDYMMPEIDGLEFIKRIRAKPEFAEVPILMVTAMEEKEVLKQAFDEGANDFISKPLEPVELNARVRNMMNLRLRTLELQRLATTDSLTGANVRRHFFAQADTEFSRCRRYDTPLSMMMLDVDFFKKVNDTYGHAAGDKVLIDVAGHCRSVIRDVDFLGRLGGEEFAICLPQTDAESAHTVAERLRVSVEESVVRDGGAEIRVTVSIGIAQVTAGDGAVTVALNRADEALYKAKESGRNRVLIAE